MTIRKYYINVKGIKMMMNTKKGFVRQLWEKITKRGNNVHPFNEYWTPPATMKSVVDLRSQENFINDFVENVTKHNVIFKKLKEKQKNDLQNKR